MLPFGDTLHYPGCGCPRAAWKAHARAADMVDQLARAGVDALLKGQLEPTRSLRVAYVLPHHKITGVPAFLQQLTTLWAGRMRSEAAVLERGCRSGPLTSRSPCLYLVLLLQGV